MVTKVVTLDELTDIINNNEAVVIKFGAEWCGPCKMMDSVLNSFSEKKPEVRIIKIDVDESEELVEKYSIANVPIIMIFKNGELAERHIGTLSENKLLEYFK